MPPILALHPVHHIHSRLFTPFPTSMGRKDVPAEGLLERAIANDYQQGGHRRRITRGTRGTIRIMWTRPLGIRTGLWDAIRSRCKHRLDHATKTYAYLVEQEGGCCREEEPDNDAMTDVCHSTGARSFRKGLPNLDLATIQDFLCFHVSLSRGRIEDRTTADLVNTFGVVF